MNDAQLVKSVSKYRSQRTKVKERQKRELEDELEPWKADVGDEIKRVRATLSASIADIANIIGVQNRTFIYEMIAASNERGRPTPTHATVDPDDDDTDDDTDPAPWGIEYGDGIARMWFDDDVSTEWYDLPIIDGTPDVPEEWGEHTRERRDLYKQIIAEIKAHG